MVDCFISCPNYFVYLTHWGWVTHICVGNLTIIGSGNGLSPDRRQAITWSNVVILLIGPLGTNFSEMLIEIHIFFIQESPFENVVWKMAAILSRPQCVDFQCCSMLVPVKWPWAMLVTKSSNPNKTQQVWIYKAPVQNFTTNINVDENIRQDKARRWISLKYHMLECV